jgi:PhnO protein
MGIEFRPARRADAIGLVPLVEELGYPAPLERVAARLALLASAPDQALFVAEEDGTLRGWIHVQAFLSLASDPAGLVTGLVVDPGVRRRGVGRALLTLAEDWARARGLASLRLRSQAMRHEAHAFYVRQGYEVVKTQLQFRKELR